MKSPGTWLIRKSLVNLFAMKKANGYIVQVLVLKITLRLMHKMKIIHSSLSPRFLLVLVVLDLHHLLTLLLDKRHLSLPCLKKKFSKWPRRGNFRNKNNFTKDTINVYWIC